RLFLMYIPPKDVPSCGLGLPVTVTSPLSFCGPAVPPCHKAVPAPRGVPLPDQHFPGGRHPHVVPVECSQRDYVDTTWNCSYLLASSVVFLNLLGQLSEWL
ncbi:hypothetical protein P7K49_006504, partial [Saguinus oedipus]